MIHLFIAQEVKNLNYLLLLLFKNVGSAWGWPYQSEDPSPTIPTYRQKEEKGKKVEDYSMDRAA